MHHVGDLLFKLASCWRPFYQNAAFVLTYSTKSAPVCPLFLQRGVIGRLFRNKVISATFSWKMSMLCAMVRSHAAEPISRGRSQWKKKERPTTAMHEGYTVGPSRIHQRSTRAHELSLLKGNPRHHQMDLAVAEWPW